MNLLFATQNSNKAAEIQNLMPAGFTVKSLADLGIHDDIPETGSTLKENALIKARYVHQKFGKSCFADDTGLEIDALDGRPGVFSARYAGEEKNADANMNKVLLELESKSNRKACFKTVIALILDTEEYLFEGIVEGVILENKIGIDGFGYDPIFKPFGYDLSFAQMTLEEKNKISHRGRAIAKMIDFLNKLKLN